MSWIRKLSLTFASSVLMLPLLPMSPGLANTMAGGCSSGLPCRIQNSSMVLSYHLTSGFRTATERTRTESYDTTDLTVTLGSDDVADVIYYVDDNMEDRVWGSYRCLAVTTFYCDAGRVYYHGDKWAAANMTESDTQSLACHETGHSVGLYHPDNDSQDSTFACMRVNNFSSRFLGTHNANHINDAYN